jgi:tetratricopeptide (TPR) repeat protein
VGRVDPGHGARAGPRSAQRHLHAQSVLELSFLRRYHDAARVVDNLLAWKPDDLGFQLIRAEIDVEGKADLTRMREILARDLSGDADQNIVRTYRFILAYFQRDFGAAEKALAGYAMWDTTHGFSTPRAYMEGLVAWALGETEPATAAFQRARELAAVSVATRSDDAKALIVLAKIDAKLGRKEEAVREAEQAVALLPVSIDTYDGPLMLVRLAQVYAGVQEIDRALAILEEAAAIPAGAAYGYLQLDAEFDPLRNHPRFHRVLASLAPTQKR